MGEKPDDFVNLWEDLLSRNASLIRATFSLLEDEARYQVLEHLQSMAHLPGWQEQQVISAKIALEALSSQSNEGLEKDDGD